MPDPVIQPALAFNFWVLLWQVQGPSMFGIEPDTAGRLALGIGSGLLSAGSQALFGAFSDASGLNASLEIETYQEGGHNHGPRKFPKWGKYDSVSFKRGVTPRTSLWDWHAQILAGSQPAIRKSGLVILFDRGNTGDTLASGGLRIPLAAWYVDNALPEKITGPTLDAKSNTVAIESVDLAHEGLSRVSLAMIPGAADAIGSLAARSEAGRAMEKATIKMVTASAPNDVAIDVMFNPSEYQITRNMSYAEIGVPGLAMPLLQFVRGESQQLQLELFLDSSERKQGALLAAASSGVGALPGASTDSDTAGITPVPPDRWPELARSPHAEHRLMALRRLAEIDAHLHAPPVVEFSWSGARFRGVITSFTEKFTMFDATGRIVRARVQLQLKSWSSAEAMVQATNQMSPDRTKTRVVRAGDRLDLIAAEEYGDPAQWVVIAKANGITRPRILVPGTLLVLPPLD